MAVNDHVSCCIKAESVAFLTYLTTMSFLFVRFCGIAPSSLLFCKYLHIHSKVIHLLGENTLFQFLSNHIKLTASGGGADC